MGFIEGSIKEEKVFGDTVFPKTLLPSSISTSGVEEFIKTIEKERESLHTMLQVHGAILFRGFEVHTAEEFDRVVVAFGWEDLPYVGAAERVGVTDRVKTANETSLDVFINFHHEMAFVKQSPSKLFFFCELPASEGGATSIIPSNIVVENLEKRHPEVISKFSKVGCTFRMLTPKGDQPMLRKRQTLNYDEVIYNADGSAEFVFGPRNPIREIEGKRVCFLPLLGYNLLEMSNSYGDGSVIPDNVYDAYAEILQENCVDVKWEKGDVLLLDNNVIQHARRPAKPPRRVLVALMK